MDNSHEPGLNPITRGCYPAVALPGSKSGTPVDKPVFHGVYMGHNLRGSIYHW